MAGTQKTREQLVQELEKARAQIAQLQRANAEESLRDNEEKYRLFVDNAFEGIVLLDTKGKITDINPCAAEIAGLERGELIGKHVVQLVPLIKFDIKRALSLLKSAIRGESPSVSEMTITNRAGKQHIIEGILNPIRKADKIIGVSLIVKEITAYKRMTELLTNQRDLAASLGAITDLTAALDCLLETALKLESIDCGGVYLVDERSGEIELAAHRGLSPAFVESAAHYAADSAHARIVMAGELLHRPYSELIPSVKDEIQEREELQAIVTVPVLHGGRVVAAMNLASHVHDEIPGYELDALQAIAAQIGGVIARLRAEAQMIAALEALRESEGKFRNIVESLPLGMHMYELQAEQRLVFVGANPAADAILGVDNATFIGKTIEEAFPPLANTQAPARYRQAAAQGTPWRTEQIEYDEGGIKGAFEVIAFQTTPGEMAAMFQDITKRAQTAEALRESEKRYRLIAENVEDVIWTMDINLDFTYVSPSIYHQRGYTVEQVMAQSLNEIMTPESLEKVLGILAQKLALIEAGDDAGWEAATFEVEQYCQDGTTIWTHNNAKLLPDPDERPAGIVGVTRDITERKRVDEALRESEEKYRALFEHLPIPSFTKNRKGEYTSCNVENQKYWAVNPIGRTDAELLDHETAAALREADLHVMETGDTLTVEEHLVNTPLGERQVLSRKMPLRDGSGNIVGILGASLDITERARAAEALRESQARFQDLYDNAPNAYFSVGADGHIRHCNRRAGELLGYPLEELVGRPALGLYAGTPQGKEKATRLFEQLRAGEMIHDETLQMQKADGSPVWISLTVNAVRDAQGQVLESRSMVVDISERVRAAEALQESEARLQSIFRAAPVGIGLTSNRTILQVNEQICEMLGYSSDELVGKNGRVLYPTDEDFEYVGREKYAQIRERGTGTVETRWKRKDGQIVDVLLSSTPLDPTNLSANVTFTALDITERKWAEEELNRYQDHLEDLVQERTRELGEAQAELVRKERLSALGQFTATVAHEIRNPLGTVRTCVFAISDSIEQGATNRVENALQIAERNIVRCDNIINELLDYSRDRELQLQSTPVDTWLGALLDEQAMTQDIVCVRELTSGVKVPLDREHLRRAVVNVVENAVQAMQEQASQEQQLTVCTRIAGDGSRLEIEVRDKGPGIPDDVLPRIFEPLFSTKSYGVGLGLSVVKNVMEQHGGGVSVQSKVADDEQPGGTSVVLWLPVDF